MLKYWVSSTVQCGSLLIELKKKESKIICYANWSISVSCNALHLQGKQLKALRRKILACHIREERSV